ncbi:MAG: molybdopterin-dependent oxidoreductase, partial [Gammaproteobacteria bacterium]|nr:molybdopterin-dependent oxidoreductase [Gammaproteobacteria bacterium]
MTTTTHYRACNLCEAICGLEITVTDGQIDSIKGDKNDPLSRGHICPKAVALKDIQEDPDRLRGPVRKTGNGWMPISWDEAFALVAKRLSSVIEANGPNAVGIYFGNPNVHNYGSLTHAQNFLGLIKTKNRFSATSVDQLPHQLAALKLYGHQLNVPVPDIDRTQYFLMLGNNPMASNGSIMTVPDFAKRVKALQKRGGKLVLLDPRRTETAAVADEHDFIRPQTDALFLLSLLQHIFANSLDVAPPAYVTGLEETKAAVSEFTPESVADVCGVDASRIKEIAEAFATADSAVCHGRMGCSVQSYGALCQWLIQVLNIVTGNLDAEGGAMFPQPAVDMVESPVGKPGNFDRWRSRVSGLPEFSGELPAVCMAEEMATPGESQIKALITSAGNPVLSTPNGKALEKQIRQLEFVVCIDPWINETTCHADVILPPTTPLEHDHYDMIFHSFAVRNTARFNDAVLPKPDDAKHDWEIFNGLGAALAEALGRQPRMGPTPAQMMDFALQSGRYGKARGHAAELSLSKLKETPSGIDLGALQPALPGRLQTETKTIDLAQPLYLQDIPRVRELLQAPSDGQLKLIGRRHVRSNNSWMHNSHRLTKGKTRHELLMNPADMQARGITSGQRVQIASSVGALVTEAIASDEMMPGVVSLPHGWGHQKAGVQQRIATQLAGESCNDLTDPKLVDPLSGNAAVNGVPV